MQPLRKWAPEEWRNLFRATLAMLPADAGTLFTKDTVLCCVLGPNKVLFTTGLGNLGVHQQLGEVSSGISWPFVLLSPIRVTLQFAWLVIELKVFACPNS